MFQAIQKRLSRVRFAGLCLGYGVLVLTFSGIRCGGGGGHVVDVTHLITPVDLCRSVLKDQSLIGKFVEVPLNFDLTPTFDPLVWEYRPGFPSERVAPVMRVEFSAGQRPSRVIIGRVSRIEFDTLFRPSGLHHLVVITDAVSSSQSPR